MNFCHVFHRDSEPSSCPTVSYSYRCIAQTEFSLRPGFTVCTCTIVSFPLNDSLQTPNEQVSTRLWITRRKQYDKRQNCHQGQCNLKILTSTYRRKTTIRPGRQKTTTKLTCVENTENINTKTERETKIKSQRVTIL